MHGQSDQQRLLRPARQRDALDRYAGDAVLEPLAPLPRVPRRAARPWTPSSTEITTRARERAQEAELLRLGLAEIERVDPQPGEDVAPGRRGSSGSGTPRSCGVRPPTAHDALLGGSLAGDESPTLRTRPAWSALARTALEPATCPRPRAGRAGRPARRDLLPARRPRRRPGLLRRERRRRPAAARRRRGAPGRAARAHPTPRRHHRRRAGVGRGRRAAAARARLRRRAAGGAARRGARALAASCASWPARSSAGARERRPPGSAAEVTAELIDLAMPHAELQVAVTQRRSRGRGCLRPARAGRGRAAAGAPPGCAGPAARAGCVRR